MKLSDFDYHLPEHLIAQDPIKNRDESRLMVVRKESELFEHRKFRDIVEYLNPGDVLVVNQTKVIPARLMGNKEGTGGQVEVLLLKEIEGMVWEALVKPGRRALPGTRLVFGDGRLKGSILETTKVGGRVIRFESSQPFKDVIRDVGRMPLPPYIKNYPDDPQRYQTVYALKEGSVAAPTAGLHFTDELLNKIRDAGVKVVSVLLHVGLGTFRPVKTPFIEDHRMHEEFYEISQEAADSVNEVVRKRSGRILAVGTTTVRCLESASDIGGLIQAGSGYTDIFIYPGYQFKMVEGMVTNFHLPKSTLLMMISAFAGRKTISKAYQEAVDRQYRFFSFGDAMLIL